MTFCSDLYLFPFSSSVFHPHFPCLTYQNFSFSLQHKRGKEVREKVRLPFFLGKIVELVKTGIYKWTNLILTTFNLCDNFLKIIFTFFSLFPVFPSNPPMYLTLFIDFLWPAFSFGYYCISPQGLSFSTVASCQLLLPVLVL